MSLDTVTNKRSRMDVQLFEIAETDKNIEAGSDYDNDREEKKVRDPYDRSSRFSSRSKLSL